MSILTPKVAVPPAPPPPPPPPVVPAPVVRPSDPSEAVKRKARDPKTVSRRKTIKTSARGVLEDAPWNMPASWARRKTRRPADGRPGSRRQRPR